MKGSTPSNADAERLRRVVDALIANDVASAEAQLAPIAGMTLDDRPLDLLPVLPRSAQTAGTGAQTRRPRVELVAEVYARDSFVCSYCSRKVVVLGVMGLISRRFPKEFPVHPNWKRPVTHRSFWDISATVDHVVPVSRGGGLDEIENLTTACARCQYQKRNHELAVLGWELRSAPPSDWDGSRAGTASYGTCWIGRPAASTNGGLPPSRNSALDDLTPVAATPVPVLTPPR